MSSDTIEMQIGANPDRAYYPALDGLRAVAVLMVFAVHYLDLPAGWMGVNIFFVLSGFLITGILFDTQDKPRRFRDFYIRRSLRIFPLYYVVWITLFLLTPPLHVHWHPENLLWISYIGGIRVLQVFYPAHGFLLGIASYPLHAFPEKVLYINTGHFWSLCVEEQFYLVWPFVVYSIRKRESLVRLCIVGVVAVTFLRLAALLVFPSAVITSGVLHDLILFRFDEFLVGGAAALILRGPHAARLCSWGPRLFWGFLSILVVYRVYPHFLHPGFPVLFRQNPWILSQGITMADGLALGMLLLSLNARSWMAKLFRAAPLRALGKISYGIYIFHDLPHAYYFHFLKQWGLRSQYSISAVSFVVTILLATSTYFLVERPFLRLKLRFEPKRERDVA